MWREILERKEEFQKILQLLVDFDERTGRYLRYVDNETHWMRKAIAASSPENIRVLLRHQGGYIYTIVAQIQTDSGIVASAYVHEDGIMIEREQNPDEHPVKRIVCMTDLFERSSKELANHDGLNSFTIGLIEERSGVQRHDLGDDTRQI